MRWAALLTAPGSLAEGQENHWRWPNGPVGDISEDDQEYLIKAELPEVKKEDVKLPRRRHADHHGRTQV